MAKESENKKYEDVEGIPCEIKNPGKKSVVKYYQESLIEEIDKYIGSIERWSESKKLYSENLKINVKIAPFVLGWLIKPTDEDEYRVITGRITLEELDIKRKDKANKEKKTRKAKTRTTRKAKSDTTKKQDSIKKPVSPKKPATPKKPVAPKKPTVKSLVKKQDSKKK